MVWVYSMEYTCMKFSLEVGSSCLQYCEPALALNGSGIVVYIHACYPFTYREPSSQLIWTDRNGKKYLSMLSPFWMKTLPS